MYEHRETRTAIQAFLDAKTPENATNAQKCRCETEAT